MNYLLPVINEARRGGLCKKTFPPGIPIRFVGQVHNRIGLSGNWCGQQAGYCPWVVVEVTGEERVISSFYLRQ